MMKLGERSCRPPHAIARCKKSCIIGSWVHGSCGEVIYKTYTNREMASTFEEHKQQCKKYLEEVIKYDENGNKSQAQRELQVLKEKCTEYMKNFETHCKTTKKLTDFRRVMENTWEEFYKEVDTLVEGSWEKSMFLSIKSKMETCITNLKQMERLILSGISTGITVQTASLDLTLQISNSLAQLKSFL